MTAFYSINILKSPQNYENLYEVVNEPEVYTFLLVYLSSIILLLLFAFIYSTFCSYPTIRRDLTVTLCGAETILPEIPISKSYIINNINFNNTSTNSFLSSYYYDNVHNLSPVYTSSSNYSNPMHLNQARENQLERNSASKENQQAKNGSANYYYEREKENNNLMKLVMIKNKKEGHGNPKFYSSSGQASYYNNSPNTQNLSNNQTPSLNSSSIENAGSNNYDLYSNNSSNSFYSSSPSASSTSSPSPIIINSSSRLHYYNKYRDIDSPFNNKRYNNSQAKTAKDEPNDNLQLDV